MDVDGQRMGQQITDRGVQEIERIYQKQHQEVFKKIDHRFIFIHLFQILMVSVLGGLLSPTTWLGAWLEPLTLALVGFCTASVIFLPAIFYCWRYAGALGTRYAVAVSQMGFSLLILCMSGGRATAHFYIVLSLIMLSFYRDTVVFIVASTLALALYPLLGTFFPVLVFGEEAPFSRGVEYAVGVALVSCLLFWGLRGLQKQLRDWAQSEWSLRKAQEEAIKSSSLKSTFLSNMSHEIRTPLSSILGFTEILKDTNLDAEQVEYVGTIHRCSDTLLRVVNDILDFSRIESGLLHIDAHNFNIRELHRDIHGLFILKCAEKGLRLEMRVDESIPSHVWGDSHRIRQILMNLVMNAIKFTACGKILVEVRKNPQCDDYHWRVCDTGMGIHEKNIKNLFCEFYQEAPSIPRNYGGSGLGLVISKNLVELMGGKISVESKQGEGTTFSFSLPLKKP